MTKEELILDNTLHSGEEAEDDPLADILPPLLDQARCETPALDWERELYEL